jgi:hypothetical protein
VVEGGEGPRRFEHRDHAGGDLKHLRGVSTNDAQAFAEKEGLLRLLGLLGVVLLGLGLVLRVGACYQLTTSLPLVKAFLLFVSLVLVKYI